MSTHQLCPLCQKEAQNFAENQVTAFFKCGHCFGVSADTRSLLKPRDEKERYEAHDNRVEDQRYLDFLSRLTTPLEKYLEQGMIGLDFGCGPVKAMKHLLKDKYQIDSYDYFFYPDQQLLEKKYDFILASEVVEHLYRPFEVFSNLKNLLKDQGYLAVMTQTWDEQTDFSSWWYAKDPTHVFFYHQKTFEFLCQKLEFDLLESTKNVFIFQKL